MRLFAETGSRLNAEYHVESDGRGLALVLESAGGKARGGRARNADYVVALRILLRRLADREAVINSAVVDTPNTRVLSLREHSLIEGPVALGPDTDVNELRRRLTAAQARIGQPAGGGRSGNGCKRIRLTIDVAGYGPEESTRLEFDLGKIGLTVQGLIDALTSLEPDDNGGQMAIALLWAIGQVAEGRGRLFEEPFFRAEVGRLLDQLGITDQARSMFWTLGSDATLWENRGLPDKMKSIDVNVRGGFTGPAAELLVNPVIRAEAIFAMREIFPSGLADVDDILRRVGLAGDAEKAMIGLSDALDSARDLTIRSWPAETLDRMVAAVRRVEQAELRKLAVGSGNTGRCAFCDHLFPMRYLVAVHIKPRSQCTDDERRDLRNITIAACSFGCDILFESGYITVDKDGWIRSAKATPSGRFADHVNLIGTLRCSAHRPETEPYFAWHRVNRFVLEDVVAQFDSQCTSKTA